MCEREKETEGVCVSIIMMCAREQETEKMCFKNKNYVRDRDRS